jgi:hypothetical protein
MINYAGEWFEEVNGILLPYGEILRQHLLREAQELADKEEPGEPMNEQEWHLCNLKDSHPHDGPLSDATIEDYL